MWQQFPNPMAGVAKDVAPRTEAGVACPLPTLGLPVPPASPRIGDSVQAPMSRCRLCQFHRGIEREIRPAAPGESAGGMVVCSAPEAVIIEIDPSP